MYLEHLQNSQHTEGVLLNVQGPQHRVQVRQVLGQQLPALVDQLAQLSHLACRGRNDREEYNNRDNLLMPDIYL